MLSESSYIFWILFVKSIQIESQHSPLLEESVSDYPLHIQNTDINKFPIQQITSSFYFSICKLSPLPFSDKRPKNFFTVYHFLAAIKYRWIVPSIFPWFSIILCIFSNCSKHLSTEKPGNSHSIICANHTNAPIS